MCSVFIFLALVYSALALTTYVSLSSLDCRLFAFALCHSHPMSCFRAPCPSSRAQAPAVDDDSDEDIPSEEEGSSSSSSQSSSSSD